MTELEAAQVARRRLLAALDCWPSDGALNPAFQKVSDAVTALNEWIKAHEETPESN